MAKKHGIFGPSRKAIWMQLADELDADYVKKGFFGTDKVMIYHRNWIITLDNYVVSTGNTTITYTRLRAPYVNRDDFKFHIYRKSIFSGIGKMFGMQDVEVGYRQFDDDFIIQGNDERKLKMMFANPNVRDLISLQPKISLKIKDDNGYFQEKFPNGVNELYFEVVGIIKDLGPTA